MHPNLQDTISALSSASARSGDWGARAVLRVSGPEAFPIVRRFFEPEAGQDPWPEAEQSKPHTSSRPSPRRPWRCVSGLVEWRTHRLPASAYLMPAPRSYTRQDLVELHLPALHVVLGELLVQLQQAGARQATPGEFTRRALLNGRLSLSQAEAVGALIRSSSADEARSWAARTVCRSDSPPGRIRDEIEELLTRLELGLDFSLEDVTLLSREELGRRLSTLLQRTESVTECHQEPEGLAWGGEPRVALVGPTGCGKSTLLNALAGRDVALRSAQGHTTRDPVEALVKLSPELSVRLIDTAGLDPEGTGQALTKRALEWTRRSAVAADIWLVLLDSSVPLNATQNLEGLKSLLGGAPPTAAALVWTKSDLSSAVTSDERADFEREARRLIGTGTLNVLKVAARKGVGLGELEAFVKVRAQEVLARVSSAWSAGMTAQSTGLREAREALVRANEALRLGLGEDAIAVELREAVHALSDAQGVFLRHDALTESLLDRIFIRFCIGK